MRRSAVAIAGLWLSVLVPAAAAQDTPPTAAVREIHITGAREISSQAIQDALPVRIGEPLIDTTAHLGEIVSRQYRDEGYTFARIRTGFDAASGVLSLDIDEGVIDGVVFQGVDEKLARLFENDFALRAGDVFNSRRARQALDIVLRQTRGAVTAGHTYPQQFTDSDELRRHRGAFEIIDRNGERVLLVGLRQPPARFKLVPDLGEREDWFSAVDGFVPSVGVGLAIFDHDRFNHTYIAGHLSYKTGSEWFGYALGAERPLFGRTKLYIGGEVHDLTATDDRWQASSLDASLSALGPGRPLRDYYRRRGVQFTGALRVHPQIELLAGWRGERQEALRVTTDFSFWDEDEPAARTTGARDGQLNALLLGASVAGRGFDRESLASTYRRHQFDTMFGEPVDEFDGSRDMAPVWNIDWTSELSQPGAFGSDFDFRRHIVSARTRRQLSVHQTIGARAIGGWSEGVLPPQRQFAIGGAGSVHGYDFNAQIGDSLALLNLEYELGWRHGLRAIGFFDTGHAAQRQAVNSVPGTPWLEGIGWGVAIADVRLDVGYRLDALQNAYRVTLRFGRTF